MARPKIIEGKTSRCSVVLPELLLQKVQVAAEQKCVSSSQLMREVINQHFENNLKAPSIKKNEHYANNKVILRDKFGHLKGKSFGDSVVFIGTESIEFRGEKGVHIIGVDSSNFEAKVRTYIKELQGVK